MRYGTISQIGGFAALDPSYTDFLRLVPGRCSGGADAPIRTTVQPAPGQSGGLILPPFDDAQLLTLAGDIVIKSAGDEAGYLDAIDVVIGNLKDALAALMLAPGDLVHSGGTISVWKNAPLDTGWADVVQTVTFGLVVDTGL